MVDDSQWDIISIEIMSLYPILGEVFEQTFTRNVYLVDVDGDYIKDLPEYDLDVKYVLYDCSEDFDMPTVFISIDVDQDVYDSIIDLNGDGTHFVVLYQENINTVYNFTLTEIPQNSE